jgi:hypothetical protein
MKHTQIKLFKAPSLEDLEMQANAFLRTVPSHSVLYTALKDSVLTIVYREEGVENTAPHFGKAEFVGV